MGKHTCMNWSCQQCDGLASSVMQPAQVQPAVHMMMTLAVLLMGGAGSAHPVGSFILASAQAKVSIAHSWHAAAL
jgi:hypothetical protein